MPIIVDCDVPGCKTIAEAVMELVPRRGRRQDRPLRPGDELLSYILPAGWMQLHSDARRFVTYCPQHAAAFRTSTYEGPRQPAPRPWWWRRW